MPAPTATSPTAGQDSIDPAPKVPPAAIDTGQHSISSSPVFRGSLNSALDLARSETAAVDSFVDVDIGKFSYGNFAEAMQRIPGVALSRGDGGEGCNISVRAFGERFTRIRINGMTSVSRVSASSFPGGVATGRLFDLVTFPTGILPALSVRKMTLADIEDPGTARRSAFARPRPQDSDAVGAKKTIFVDASASYNLSENIKLIAEVSNITNEQNNLYTDTLRQDPLYTSTFARTYALAVNFQF